MRTFANPCTVLPSADGVPSKKLIGRAVGKQQQRFATAVALAGVKAGGTPDKKTAAKAATVVMPPQEQVAPEARKRGNRSVPNMGQEIVAIHLMGHPAESPLAAQKRGAAKGSSGPAPSPQVQPMSPENPRLCAAHIPPPTNSPPVKGKRPDAAQDKDSIILKTEETRVEPGARGPVTTRVGSAATQKSPGGEGQHTEVVPVIQGGGRHTEAVPIVQVERWNTGGKDSQRGVGRSVEGGQLGKHEGVGEHRQHEPSVGKVATKDGGPGKPGVDQPPVTTRPISSPQQVVVADGKVTHASRAPVVGLRQESESAVQRLHPEEQPRARTQRSGNAGRQEIKTEATEPSVKEVRPGGLRERGSVPPESFMPSTGPSVATVPHPPAEVQTHELADVVTDGADNPARDVGEQILDSLRASVTQGQREVTIRLQPPELGAVVIRFREQGEQLDGILEVAETETCRQIEQALPEVVQGLQEAGIRIRRLDVISGESAGQELGRGLSQQDAWSGHFGSGHNRDQFPASQPMRPQPAADYSADPRETPNADRQTRAGRGGIDVLL